MGPIGGERPMGPIGGERAQRRAPGPIPAPPISAANDFGPAFWNIATGTVVITFQVPLLYGRKIITHST